MVYANGCGKGKGTHISVFTRILKGPYDEKLRWPLTGTIEVELLNQDSDSFHYSMKTHYCNDYLQPGGSGWG